MYKHSNNVEDLFSGFHVAWGGVDLGECRCRGQQAVIEKPTSELILFFTFAGSKF